MLHKTEANVKEILHGIAAQWARYLGNGDLALRLATASRVVMEKSAREEVLTRSVFLDQGTYSINPETLAPYLPLVDKSRSRAAKQSKRMRDIVEEGCARAHLSDIERDFLARWAKKFETGVRDFFKRCKLELLNRGISEEPAANADFDRFYAQSQIPNDIYRAIQQHLYPEDESKWTIGWIMRDLGYSVDQGADWLPSGEKLWKEMGYTSPETARVRAAERDKINKDIARGKKKAKEDKTEL